MKNKIEKGKYSHQKTTSSKKDQNETLDNKNLGLKNSNIKSEEKMIIKIDENIQKEIEQEQEKKPKIKIFNNKKNNDICSNILKKMKENEKKLIVFPYVQKKLKINKTIDTIGHSNGITYLNINLLRGGNTKYNNFISNMRFDENYIKNKRKNENKLYFKQINK